MLWHLISWNSKSDLSLNAPAMFGQIHRFSFEDGIDKDELSKRMKGCNLRWQQLPMIFKTFWGHNCLGKYNVSDHSWKSKTESVQKHGGWLWDLGWKPFRVETINDENLFWCIFKFWQIILSHKKRVACDTLRIEKPFGKHSVFTTAERGWHW